MDDTTNQMAKLYSDGWTLQKIGEKFGMTRQGVRERFIKAGIERRRWSKYRHIDKSELENLYFNENLTLPEIAKRFSVTNKVIKVALAYHKIPKRIGINRGGYIIEFLKGLEVNQQSIFRVREGRRYPKIHDAAKRMGIKISFRSKGEGEYIVTRIE